MNSLLTRNSNKEWKHKEIRFLLLCILPYFIQSIIVGRSKKEIIEAIELEAKKIEAYKLEPEKVKPTTKLRIVKKGNKNEK